MKWVSTSSWDNYIPTLKEIHFNNLQIQLQKCIDEEQYEEAKIIKEEL